MAAFVGIVAAQVIVAAISIDLLSSVRAYVGGESLYSKGQKDAQIHLADYAQHHREEDYRRFLAALAVPLGDRRAREALQQPEPDLAAARQGLREGGNHPDDIDGLIRMFLWFHRLPIVARTIATWTEGDQIIAQMRSLVERAHARLAVGELAEAALVEVRAKAPVLNATLTRLESEFSAQLGEASRLTQRVLLGVNLALACLLGLAGLAFVRRSFRLQALTEEEVRHRQQSLQRLLDSAAEGLYGVDLAGRCTFINRAALRMLGYDRESDLVGRDIHALVHHAHADGRPQSTSRSKVQAALQGQRELHVTDEVLWRQGGSSFPAEYWSHPISQNGQVQGAVVTFFDISERVQMQAALREGELRMARLVDAVTDGVISVNAGGCVVFFNRAAEALFGVLAAEAAGCQLRRFIPAGIAPQVELDPAAVRRSEVTAPAAAVYELTGLHADGHSFPIEASLSMLDTDAGTLTTVVLRDVTQQHLARAERQTREAIEASSRAKTDFLSRMSHELRTPLNAVLGFSQLLRLDTARPPSIEQLARIQHIENAGSHLLALVNDVLDLSQVESGQMAVLREPVDLQKVLADAVGMISSLAAQVGVAVHMPPPVLSQVSSPVSLVGSSPWVMADPVRLRQVLVNLLSNAVKYNRAGGRVTVHWTGTPEAWRLHIADTGPGMSPDKLACLFEPFNRLGAERSKVEGTGIGLVLSRGLVELMRGELVIESVVGEGTVAIIVLPGSDPPAARAAVLAQPSQHGGLGGGLSVLYAEDDDVNAELLRQVVGLRPAVSLQVASSGAAALRMATADPPDLMLVDMNLGDMTGTELAQKLRAHPATRGIRLVALSADALPEQIAAAIAMGFENYLTKPIDFRRLLEVLDGLLPNAD